MLKARTGREKSNSVFCIFGLPFVPDKNGLQTGSLNKTLRRELTRKKGAQRKSVRNFKVEIFRCLLLCIPSSSLTNAGVSAVNRLYSPSIPTRFN
jgi:hypothetical protein